MKTVSFELRGTSVLKTIQCRVTNGRNNVARMSTGLKTEQLFWDTKKQLTRGVSAVEKSINSKLRAIGTAIENDVNTTTLTTEWLRDIIDIASGKLRPDEKLLFLNACRDYIQGKEQSISINTLASYNRVYVLLTEFIGNGRPQIKDVDKSFMLNFEKWLTTIKKTSKNTAVQHTRFIMIILNDCSKEKGLEVSISRGYSGKPSKREKREIVYLDRIEIQAIKDLGNLPEHLENSRKWFLIGIEVGQRANDLLSITPSNITGNRLRLRQQKTKKDAVVPLFANTLALLEDFPSKISIITLNRNIKKLCELAKIESLVLKKERENGIEVLNEVPKWKAISTHSMRRTYVSLNFGVLTNELIMSVTKHSSEAQLIKYMGLSDDEIADKYEKEIEKLKLDGKN
jgi:integrase